MVCRRPDDLYVVVNAGCKDQDIAHLQQHLSGRCQVIPMPERALLALQGPAGRHRALAPLGTRASRRLTFMEGGFFKLDAFDVFLTRSGLHRRRRLRDQHARARRHRHRPRAAGRSPRSSPLALGARDTLRLEAGLCLYGHDITTTTTPAEAALTWAIQKVRRGGGARAGGYPGFAVIDAATARHASRNRPQRKRVGLVSNEKLPVREGAKLVTPMAPNWASSPAARWAPRSAHLVAMGYVATQPCRHGHRSVCRWCATSACP